MVSTNILKRDDFMLKMNFLHMACSLNLCICLKELSILHFFATHIHYARLTLQSTLLITQGQRHELLLQLANYGGIITPVKHA